MTEAEKVELQTTEPVFKDGWYWELSDLWPGEARTLQIKEVLHHSKSDFQDICIVETESYGTVLLLNGIIQCTDRDEFSYQEMIAHVPLCALERPAKKVLVVGGGDGGVLREIARHADVEEIHIAEIDGKVVDLCKEYFPEMAVGYKDPRVHVHICDGIKYVEDAADDTFDVIIVDSSDPVGPAEVLFSEPFYRQLHRVVKPGGIVCSLAESFWLHMEIIKTLVGMCKGIFTGGSVSYAWHSIPTYPSGVMGLVLCAKAVPGAETPLDPRVPRQSSPPAIAKLGVPSCRYYTSDVHRAAFSLPAWALAALGPLTTFQEPEA